MPSRAMCLLAVLIAVLAGTATADIVRLRNGSELEGEIVRETDDAIHIRMHGGVLRIGRSTIAEVIRDAPLPPERKRAVVVPKDAIDLYDVAALGAITVTARGDGIRAVRLSIAHARNTPARYFLAAGSRFEPVLREGRKPAQTMDALVEYVNVVRLDEALRLSRHPSPAVRRLTVRMLSRIHDDAAGQRLVELLDDPEVRGEVLSRGQHRVVLLELAGMDDLRVRRGAYLYLRGLPRNREVELQLIAGLSDPDTMVRRTAIDALNSANYGRRSPIEKDLERLLATDPDRGVRMSAGSALATWIGRRAIPALDRAIRKTDSKPEKTAHRNSILMVRFTPPR